MIESQPPHSDKAFRLQNDPTFAVGKSQTGKLCRSGEVCRVDRLGCGLFFGIQTVIVRAK